MDEAKAIENQLSELLKDLPPSAHIRITATSVSIDVHVECPVGDKFNTLRHKFRPGEDSILGVASRSASFLTKELAVRQEQRERWLAEQTVNSDDEALIEKCLEIIREENRASPALFQRRLRIGYGQAQEIIEILERRGILGPGAHAQSREILRVPEI